MVIGKEKFALWITPEAKKEVEAHYKQDNCKSQSEYIEKAVRFYSGYLEYLAERPRSHGLFSADGAADLE